MTDPTAAQAFLAGEIEALAEFEFVAVIPGGHPQHLIETARAEGGGIEVSVPGRVPPLPDFEASQRAGLERRGFAPADANDRTSPWRCAVGDAEAGATLMLDVLSGVFGEKPDAPLDVGHGSHRAEHEARANLGKARSRIEPIAKEIVGAPVEQDADQDYILPIGDVHVMVAPRAMPDGRVVIRIFAITNVGVVVSPELGLFLARLNFGLMFGRFALDTENRSIWFDESILGSEFREEELRFAIRMVASTADGWDDRLKQMFGGVTYQEAMKDRAGQQPPPSKPGEGVGLYL